MSKIKICGLKRKEDIEYVNLAKPDYAGFVFAGIKRKIDFQTAANFRSLLNKNIKSAGVFVNEPIENIISLCKDKTIDIIQLHGNENEQYIDALRQKADNKIIKSVVVNQTSKLPGFQTSNIDFLLFDSGMGSGETFDWDLIKGYDKPFFLAGGLNKDNIAKALKTLKPYCVDLSSGVETNGLKDFEKIKEIIEIIRSIK